MMWKRDMALLRQDKHASRQLAAQLFPAKQDVLQRSKDHGRAEALLIGAQQQPTRQAHVMNIPVSQ